MTLIIGFVCQEGIGLVSDTKVTNTETMEPTFTQKILMPLKETPFIVGAAGYSDLFNEFYRKVPDKVEQRIKQYKIANIEQLMRTGLSRQEAVSKVKLLQKSITATQQSLMVGGEKIEKTPTIIDDVELPYDYSAENFLDDCKDLIRTITQNSGYSNPIELLIGLKSDVRSFPQLFRMDARGRESEVDTFTAIGSGEPHVRMFFSRLYNPEKSLHELATDAIRTIVYVQDMARENTVGFSESYPPDVVVIDSDTTENNYGHVKYANMKKVLGDIKNEMLTFEKLVENSKINTLEMS